MGSQCSVPRDSNGFFWLAQKWLTTFTFVVLIKMLCCYSDAVDWDLTYKDLIKKIVCNTESNKCIMHRCESCPGTATQKFLEEHEDGEKFNYCQWDTTDRAIFTVKEYKETLIDVIDDLTRHSYITKLKMTFSWYRAKSKATTGVRNTASYIPWLYITWDQMVASNMINCVLVLMATTITQPFCIKFKQLWQLLRTVQKLQEVYGFTINKLFSKRFISLNECLIRKAKTGQYSYFWLLILHYFF